MQTELQEEEEEEYEEGEEEEEEEKELPNNDLDDGDEILFVPEWNDEDILEQPMNLKRDAPAAYDVSVPDSVDIHL